MMASPPGLKTGLPEGLALILHEGPVIPCPNYPQQPYKPSSHDNKHTQILG